MTYDGISGIRFDRPGFTAMMEEVEAGRVDTIIIKDMSRLGRDYLKVGQVMEILQQRGIRLIAINDSLLLHLINHSNLKFFSFLMALLKTPQKCGAACQSRQATKQVGYGTLTQKNAAQVFPMRHILFSKQIAVCAGAS